MAKVKVLSPNSGDVNDQAQLAVPNSPSFVGVKIIEVEDTPPATPSWADVLAIGAGNGGTVPVLDTRIETAPGLFLTVAGDTGFRAELNNGTPLLILGTLSNISTAPPGAALVKSTLTAAVWRLQIPVSVPFFLSIPDSSVAGYTASLLTNNSYVIGPFDTAGNMESICVTCALPGGPMAAPMVAGQTVTVEVLKNGVVWYTIVCTGNGTRCFWMTSGSMVSANQFAVADIITCRLTLTAWPLGGSVVRPRVNCIISLRCGGN